MLVLSRRQGERIHIGEGIVLTVLQLKNHQVRLGIEAPADVDIFREEVRNQWREAERLEQSKQQQGEAVKPVH
jgi:carbon storage regulator